MRDNEFVQDDSAILVSPLREVPEGCATGYEDKVRLLRNSTSRHVDRVQLFQRALRERGGCKICLRKWRGRTPKSKLHYHC